MLKYLIVALCMALLLSSCTLMHKTANKQYDKTKERIISNTDSVRKLTTDSSYLKQIDSAAGRSITYTEETTKESIVDTNIYIKGDTIHTELSADSDQLYIETPDNTLTIKKVPGSNKYDVQLINKAKTIPVKQHLKETSKKNYKDSSYAKVNNNISVVKKITDSVSKHVSVDIRKKVHRETINKNKWRIGVPWWVWLILVIVILVCIYYRKNIHSWWLNLNRNDINKF